MGTSDVITCPLLVAVGLALILQFLNGQLPPRALLPAQPQPYGQCWRWHTHRAPA